MLARLVALAIVMVFAWPAAAGAAMLPWSDHFGSNDFGGWTWWGEDDPTYGLTSTPRADDERIPRWRSGYERVGRFEVDDPERLHAKLFYTWFQRDAPPADVSGTYTASYYIPSDYEVPTGAATNIFQWKERWDDDARQDPSWWVNLGGARWALTVGGAQWVGARPSGTDDRPVLFLNNWSANSRDHVLMQAPLDRWFEIRAELHQGDRIDFYVDGSFYATVEDSEYPVGMFQSDGSEWTFGVGNYTDNPSTLYVGEASYEPFDTPSGWEFVGNTEEVGGGTSIPTRLPKGLTDGDALVLVASVHGNRTSTLSTPTGWTRHHIGYQPAGGTYAVYTKPYVAESTPAPTLTWGGAGAGTAYVMGAWRGADPTSPVNAHASGSSAIASRSATSPTITTTVDDTLLVWAALDFAANGPLAPPTGFTQRDWALSQKLGGTRGVVPALTGTMQYLDGWFASVLALRPRTW